MATTFSNLTYAGKYYTELFGPGLLNPATLIDAGMATAIDRTKFKSTINEITDTVELKNPTAAFSTQTSSDTVDEVNLSTVPYEFHKTISLDTIRQSWMSGDLKDGSLNDYEYDRLADAFLRDVYIPKLLLANDHLVLRGKTGLPATIGSITFSAAYTGLYALMNASASVRKLGLSGAQGSNMTVASVTKGTTTTLTLAAGTLATTYLTPGNIVSIRLAAGTGWTALNVDVEVLAVTNDTTIVVDLDTDALTSGNYTANSARVRFINSNNIVSVLASHMRRIPVHVRRQDVKIAIPSHLDIEWQVAMANAQLNGGQYVMTAHEMNMLGKRLVFLDSAPANTLGTWEANRVFYGYDLLDDVSKVEMLWQGATGNKFYNLRAGMKTGVAISKLFANEMTLTTPES